MTVVALVTWSSLADAEPVPAARPDPLTKQLTTLVDDAVATRVAPAISVAVARDGNAPILIARGMADIAGHASATPATVFRIGSISKQFTAASVMLLAEQSKLSLNDAIERYVAVPAYMRGITLRQLLSQRSGLPDFKGAADFDGGRASTPDELIALVAKQRLHFTPGQRFEYSNTNYVLLGMVIEQVSGQPYAEFVTQHVVKAAGLTSTTYCGNETRAIGYAPARGNELVPAPRVDISTSFSAGGLCSTPEDLLRWAAALAAGTVVTAESYAAMSTPANGGTYGFGLYHSKPHGQELVWHDGLVVGYRALLVNVPAHHITVAMLANTHDDAVMKLYQRLLKLVIAAP